MKAIRITAYGGPEVLQVCEVGAPEPVGKEVLIRVKAAGINRPDIFQRKGNYPAPAGVPDDIPGLEVSGVIEALGPQASGWQIGDDVCALVAGGGYAEYVVADEGVCLPVPAGISYTEAAALPETVFTVWDNVFRRGKLQAGEHLLVHGGAGGIGSTAIQLAKAMGASVSTTVSTAEKEIFCRNLGADHVIRYKQEDFEVALKDVGIDVVLDAVGGTYFAKNMRLLRADGRLIHINAMRGGIVELDILQMMQKRIEITGSTLRSRDIDFKQKLRNAVRYQVWPLVASGKLRPPISAVFPFEEAAEAHRMMENGNVLGKLVLVL